MTHTQEKINVAQPQTEIREKSLAALNRCLEMTEESGKP